MSDNLSELLGRKGIQDNFFNKLGELAKPEGAPSEEAMAKLAEEFDGLAKGVKRAEQLKGRESKFYSVFKDRGMTEMKAGGYMKKKMAAGGSLEMVEKNGKKVPFYAADGVGKMAKGGKVSKAMGEDRTSVPAEYSAKAQSKKPVKKKMGGGKVYKRKHGGKTVSGNDGNSIVAACYD